MSLLSWARGAQGTPPPTAVTPPPLLDSVQRILGHRTIKGVRFLRAMRCIFLLLGGSDREYEADGVWPQNPSNLAQKPLGSRTLPGRFLSWGEGLRLRLKWSKKTQPSRSRRAGAAATCQLCPITAGDPGPTAELPLGQVLGGGGAASWSASSHVCLSVCPPPPREKGAVTGMGPWGWDGDSTVGVRTVGTVLGDHHGGGMGLGGGGGRTGPWGSALQEGD